jgi:succinyl-diaminopimelate desuccinylase
VPSTQVASAERLAELTLAAVRIPSETGDEAAAADWALREATARGARASRVGHSVVAMAPGRGNGPTIGLFGHLDTVKPAADQAYDLRDGRIYGCGASDMKGALACMLEGIGVPRSADLVLVFYEREEGPYADNGLRMLFEQGAIPKMDLALAMEPTSNAIQAGCMGGLHAQVTFRGKRAHSARPWQGDNAIYKATRYLDRLAAFKPREVVVGGLTFTEVMSATMAGTANSRNVVPDAFTINVNYRFAPGKRVAEAISELESLVAREADVEVIDEAPAGDVSHAHPLLAAWKERNGLLVEPKQAWTDVAQLTAAGIPAINFGPGDPAQAHQAGEFVEVAALVRGFELLKDLLA